MLTESIYTFRTSVLHHLLRGKIGNIIGNKSYLSQLNSLPNISIVIITQLTDAKHAQHAKVSVTIVYLE